jgi:hypothetical protein
VVKCQTCQLCFDLCLPGLCPLACCVMCCDLFKPMGFQAGPVCHCTCAYCCKCVPEFACCSNHSMTWCEIQDLGASKKNDDAQKDAAPGEKGTAE